MSTKKRIASAVVRVAGFALVAGVFSAATFGVVRPVALMSVNASSPRRLPAGVVSAKPTINGVRRVLLVPPKTPGAAPLAMGSDGAPAHPGPIGRRALVLRVPWSTDFARKASRTRGQPLSIA